MKVSVVGGGGLVGSMAAFALHLGKVATDIAIVDANEQVGQGVALDILQGTSLVADQRVVSGPIQEHIPSSDVVVVTAGPTMPQKELPPPTERPAERASTVPH